MKRLVAVLALILLLGVAGPVGAHDLDLFGLVAVSPQGEVSIRIVDIYGARLEGMKVEAFATAPGAKPGRPVQMTEEPAGTYRAQVKPQEGSGPYQVTVDLRLADDLHRIMVEVVPGEGQAERRLIMGQIDLQSGLPWSRILFGGAALVLAAATVVALRRRSATAGEG